MTKAKRDIHAEMTQRFIDAMGDSDTLPWVRTWDADAGTPCNAVTTRRYSGINTLMLWITGMARGYESNRWGTYNQFRKAGGHVRRGESGTAISFYRRIEREETDGDGNPVHDDDGNPKLYSFMVAAAHTVFNIDQCDGLPDEITSSANPARNDTHEGYSAQADRIARNAGARIVTGDPAYLPASDCITMPGAHEFETDSSYAATLYHELIHWTGADDRLGRKFQPESDGYAMEELIAEIGSAMICATLDVPGEQRHEGYVKHWLSHLKNDTRYISRAASEAQKAADFLLGGSRGVPVPDA